MSEAAQERILGALDARQDRTESDVAALSGQVGALSGQVQALSQEVRQVRRTQDEILEAVQAHDRRTRPAPPGTWDEVARGALSRLATPLGLTSMGTAALLAGAGLSLAIGASSVSELGPVVEDLSAVQVGTDPAPPSRDTDDPGVPSLPVPRP